MTARLRIGVWTACLSMALGTVMAAGAQPPAPCEQDARHRALDFWLGEWQVVDGDGQAVGTNSIEKRQNGCLIEERWTSASGGTGQSMNYLDPADGLWKQNWVDQGGGVVQYEGGVEDGVLRYQGQHVRRDGTVTMARLVLEPIGNGRLRHLIEHSSDDGSTWSVYFDGTYVPAGQEVGIADAAAATGEEATAMPPIAAAPKAVEPVTEPQVAKAPIADDAVAQPQQTSTPAESPTQPQAARQAEEEGSDVKALTRELQREEIPETQAPELVMASPMILEVTPGNVEDYPEGTAWRTQETGGFICDEVTLRQVGVGRKVKRDKVHIIVASTLFTHRRQKKVDLLVELVDDGTVVASEELGKIRLGLNIPAHGEEGLVALAELEITAEQFDALFAGDASPLLRFTLTCPSAR